MTIHDIVVDLTNNPRPVVCLDTCILLDLVRAGWREPVAELRAAMQLLAAIEDAPPRAAVVVTYLIPTEFGQNLAEVRTAADGAVQKAAGLFDAAAVVGRNVTPPAFSVAPTLVDDMTQAAQWLLGGALLIDRDAACVDRAIDRVVAKAKPAANGGVKDAIHLEHYLALSHAIAAAGVHCRRTFVSSNKADFSTAKNNPQLDPVLKANDLDPASLEFFLAPRSRRRFARYLICKLRHT